MFLGELQSQIHAILKDQQKTSKKLNRVCLFCTREEFFYRREQIRLEQILFFVQISKVTEKSINQF